MAGQFLTTEQLAERWSCSPREVRRMAQQRRVAGMRLGVHRWRFSLAAVEAFETAHTAEPVSGSSPSTEGRKEEVSTAPFAGFTLPDGYTPRFPEAWGMEPRTKRTASQRH